MKTRTLLLAVLLFPLLAGHAVSSSAETTLVRAKAYVDVDKGRLVSPANILVEDGMIRAINEDAPADARVIDLGERYLLPGLMDMHVHLGLDFDSANFAIITTESGSEGALRSARNAELTLQSGFTTVRSIGQLHPTLDLVDVALAHAIENDWVAGPRVIPSGHMISILGGHGDLSMIEGLSEGMLELGPEYGIVNGVDDAIRATRFQIKHGAKTIKIHATAGVMSLEDSVGAQQLSDAEMQAIVEEAHRHDIPVAAHAHGTEGIKAAIRAGVDSIEHGSLLDDEAIALMKEHGVVLVPTSGLMETMDFNKLNPQKRAKAEYIAPRARASLEKAIKAGVKVAVGTDAPLIAHGRNAYEIATMVDRGMTPAQALRAATLVPAELVRVKNLGEIKTGMHADLIAVDENPLDNIRTLEHVPFVMKGGKVYKHNQ